MQVIAESAAGHPQGAYCEGALREEITATTVTGGIIGASAGLRGVLERVSRVAATESTVLITGETGTGKELIARAIHAAVPAGQARGGQGQLCRPPRGAHRLRALRPREGRLHRCPRRRRGGSSWRTGGTIFLDEVGELPLVAAGRPPARAAGARVRARGRQRDAADGRPRRGGHQPEPEEAVRDGKFREDLFYRLNVFPIRCRRCGSGREDIPLLAEYWASHYARKVGKAVAAIDDGHDRAPRLSWPGNIRELRNVVERAVILARGSVLGLFDFELPGLGSESRRPARGGPGDERQQIEEALTASGAESTGTAGRRRRSASRPARSSPASAGS